MHNRYFYLIYAVLQVFGFVFCWRIPGPDVEHTIAHQLGASFLFFAWSLSTFAYGALVVDALKIGKSRFVLSLFFGSVIMSFLAYLLGVVGLLHEKFRILYYLLLILPILIVFRRQHQLPKLAFTWNTWFTVILAFLVLPRFVFASTPSAFWDALWYHLPSMQAWWKAGEYFYSIDAIGGFQSGSWETIYLWPVLLLGGRDGQGLVLMQIFSQQQHLIFGFLGSLLCLYELVRYFTSKRFVPFVAACSIMSLSILPMATFAKNDWGIIFWLLSLTLLLVRYRNHFLYKPWLTGALMGFIVSSKWSSFVGAMAIFIFLLLTAKKRSLFKLGQFCGFAFVGMLPILLRNLYYLNAPTFPMALGLYDTEVVGPTYLGAIKTYSSIYNDSVFKHVVAKIGIVLANNPLVYIYALIPISLLLERRLSARSIFQVITILVSIPYILGSAVKIEPRILGPFLVLLNMLASAQLASFLQWRFVRDRIVYLIQFLWFVALFFPEHYIRHSSMQEIKLLRPELAIRTHLAGSSLAWIRLNISRDQKILFYVEGKTYYLSHYPVVRLWDSGRLDRKILEAQNLQKRLEFLIDEGFDITVIGAMRIDKFYNEDIVNELNSAWKQYPEAVLYAAKYSRVISLKRLLAAMNDE